MNQDRGKDLSNFSMYDLFSMETLDRCNELTEGLLRVEEDPGSAKNLERLMRSAHSLKGAARIVGLEDAVRIAHAMEDVFVAAQKGRIRLGQPHVDVLLKAVDVLSALGRQKESDIGRWIDSHQGLIRDIEAAVRGIETGAVPGAGVRDGAPSSPGSEATDLTMPQENHTKNGSSTPAGSVSDKTLRISTDNLDRLTALAGAVLVQSRWLPRFAESILRLKRTQDAMWGNLHKLSQIVVGAVPAHTHSAQIYSLLRDTEKVRMLLAECLEQIEDRACQASTLSHRLYHELLATRMRPFAQGIKGYPRLVRDLARELGKQVRFEVEGAETPVDREILEKIDPALTHLIRNAIDHGIETPEKRFAAGKPDQAILSLTARHAAGMLHIVVADDGCGVDHSRLRKSIVDRGFLAQSVAEVLDEGELMEFLFLPGVSTKTSVTEISGRGVGLDVVKSDVQALHGSVRVVSTPGHGTRFELQLPLTLSVSRVLLTDIGGEPYAFPLGAIDSAFQLHQEELEELEGCQYCAREGKRIGLVTARQVFGIEERPAEGQVLSVVIVSDACHRYGLVVDRFLGVQDLAVQGLDPRLDTIQDISAGAILEDGTPCLIVDTDELLRSIDTLLAERSLRRSSGQPAADGTPLRKSILVVDDSVTVRELERTMLKARGYDVDLALDGMEAWNAVRSNRYDLVVTDIDMPRMDGIELVCRIKGDTRLKSMPVVVVSYKDRPEDRARGLEAGADYYLGKGSFHDETFVQAVQDLIGP